jgi:hypothetical protein
MSPIQTESRKALRELIDLLSEIDERWAGPEWNLQSESDVANAHRALMHMLEGGLITFFETDATRPRWQRIVSATRKITGDNADAIYYDAPVSPEYSYRVRGRMDGACTSRSRSSATPRTATWPRARAACSTTRSSTSTPRAGSSCASAASPRRATGSRSSRRHAHHDAPLLRERAARGRRPHAQPRARDRGDRRDARAARPSDGSVARGIRRVATFVKSRTLDQLPMGQRSSRRSCRSRPTSSRSP